MAASSSSRRRDTLTLTLPRTLTPNPRRLPLTPNLSPPYQAAKLLELEEKIEALGADRQVTPEPEP